MVRLSSVRERDEAGPERMDSPTPAPAPSPAPARNGDPSPRKTVRAVAVVAVIVACAAGLLVISTPSGDGGPSVRVLPGAPSTPDLELLPPTLAGVDLTSQLTGQQAVAQVMDLHLTGFPLSWAEVAWYGDQAVAWVARGRAGQEPSALAAKMADSIAKAGDSGFTPPEPVEGLPGVWQTTGFDQLHYFFAAGDAVWWVSAADGIGDAALTELLRFAG
jgi:hypothetical protein